ncbi:MAG: DMT family transporter [Pseudomonadota bacterium]
MTPSASVAPSAPSAPSARAWTLLLLLGAIWGGAFFFTEIALEAMSPFTLVAHRVVWAAAALWLYLLLAGRVRTPLTAGLWGRWAVMGLLNNIAPFSLIMWGQTAIEGGLASIFNAMTAPFGVLVAALFLADERLSFQKIAGVLLGIAGVAAIVGADALDGLDPRSLGQFAVLLATVSYAFASVWGRVALKGVPVELNAAGMLAMSAVMILPVALVVDGPPSFALSLPVWGAIFGISLVGTAIAYLLYFEILRLAGAGNTMLVTLIVPPFAIGLGAVFLGERLEPAAFFGFGLIALGLAVIDGRLFRRRGQGNSTPIQ